jgi:hypothetical protein
MSTVHAPRWKTDTIAQVGENDGYHVRHAANPDVELVFTKDEWNEFLAAAKDGQFDPGTFAA